MSNEPEIMVITDALLEGRGQAAVAIADDFRAANFATALEAYVAALNVSAASPQYATLWTSTGGRMTAFVVDPRYRGRRYARIMRKDVNQHGVVATEYNSVHSFVDLASGVIYKPAGIKGPTLNLARGSIYDLENAPTHRIYGL